MAGAIATTTRTQAEAALIETFGARKASLPGGREIASRREAAFRRFENSGLPHRRVEEWKYTDLRALMRDAKPPAPPPSAAAKEQAKSAGAVLAGVHTNRVVFVDGTYVAELSSRSFEAGVTVTSLAEALAKGDANVVARVSQPNDAEDVALALNTAFMTDGAVIRVPAGAVVADPLYLVFVHSGGQATSVVTRSLVIVEPGAHVTIAESHEGPDGLSYQVNTALDLAVGDRARVNHVKIGSEGDAALHLSTLTATVGADAEVRDFTFTLGGGVTRHQLFVTCNGMRAQLNLAGASLLRHREHADITLVLDHAVGGCRSRERYKSVLDGESRGVFQGKIVVRPAAQKTDARMMANALLLSEHAEADNKPELEIFADDVQCGHGATAGALDDNLKFYLMARGISELEAETLLSQAFVGEAIDTIEHEGIRDALMFAAVRWLGQRV
jgi:Fe-S cluster assembly protein SufD